MFKELLLTSFNSEIKSEFMKLKDSYEPLLLRSDNKFIPTFYHWKEFLYQDCKFYLDRRHKNENSDLQIADFFEISNQPGRSKAYSHSDTKQPLHNDNAWFKDGAELILFIMNKQAQKGGENIFYPVHNLIIDLEKEEKELLNDLMNVPVRISKGEDNSFNNTTILKNDNGWKIFWNYYRIEKKERIIKDICENFFRFLSRKSESTSVLKLRLETNDACSFNDQRVLHGRESFWATKPKERILYQSMWHMS